MVGLITDAVGVGLPVVQRQGNVQPSGMTEYVRVSGGMHSTHLNRGHSIVVVVVVVVRLLGGNPEMVAIGWVILRR